MEKEDGGREGVWESEGKSEVSRKWGKARYEGKRKRELKENELWEGGKDGVKDYEREMRNLRGCEAIGMKSNDVEEGK